MNQPLKEIAQHRELIKEIAQRLWDGGEYEDTVLPPNVVGNNSPHIGATARELARLDAQVGELQKQLADATKWDDARCKDLAEVGMANAQLVRRAEEAEKALTELHDRIAKLEEASQASNQALTGEQLERIITAALATK